MADQQETPDNDELEGITEDDAKRLLEKPEGKPDGDSKDDGARDEHLSPAGQRAYERVKEERRSFREERDRAKAELAEAQRSLSKYSDKDKSETERLTAERDDLRGRVEKAEASMKRREFAEEFAPEHATAAQIRAVAKRLAGDTDEALEADAKELYALIAPEPAKPPVSGKPRERLRGGGDPTDEPDEMDPKKLAARIGRAR